MIGQGLLGGGGLLGAVGVLDLLPALLLPAVILTALAVHMLLYGGETRRRREAWARFDALARIRGLTRGERVALASWARVFAATTPHLVLSRRQDFDRFVRYEVERLPQPTSAARGQALEALRQLRVRLGFDRPRQRALSSHDLCPGEALSLSEEPLEGAPDEVVWQVWVEDVTEEGVVIELPRRRAGRGTPLDLHRKVWAEFNRDEGSYRFQTQAWPHGVTASLAILRHGAFLLHEDRRVEPRIQLEVDPFWVAVVKLPDKEAPEDPEGVEVQALDVSTGGVALLADREVRKGSELAIDLPLGGGLMVRGLTARVLGCGLREGGGRWAHFLHCEFVEVRPVQNRVLETFVASRVPE